MTAPLIIGLTGHVGAGKDTVADLLAGRGWRRLAFADALRIEVAAAWHVDIRTLTERTTKDTPLRALRVGNADHRDWLMYAAVQGWSLLDERSPRWVMQRWGEFRRLQNVDWWVRHVEVWLHTQRRENRAPGLVVTDVRMPNEAAMLRRTGALLVRVHRPGAGLTAPDTASHDSEGHVTLQVDDDLDNSGTLHDLWLQVDELVQRLLRRTGAAHGAQLLDARAQWEAPR